MRVSRRGMSGRKPDMLILTRRPGESLYVGDAIRITVLSLQGKNVRIGLDVPEDMVVYREEVYGRVSEENRMALAINTEDLLTAAQIWKGRQSKS
jgi:carbon storage regulator